MFVIAATGTFTGCRILFLHTVQILAGGRAEIYTGVCVSVLWGGCRDDMFQTEEKEKEKLWDGPHKYRRAKRSPRTRLDVPELRTALLNLTTMEIKYGDLQGSQLRGMSPSCFLSRARSHRFYVQNVKKNSFLKRPIVLNFLFCPWKKNTKYYVSTFVKGKPQRTRCPTN